MRSGAKSPRLAVGLTRFSTAEQGQSGLDLEAQQSSIRSFVTAQGWTLVSEYSDIASGKDDRRAGLPMQFDPADPVLVRRRMIWDGGDCSGLECLAHLG